MTTLRERLKQIPDRLVDSYIDGDARPHRLADIIEGISAPEVADLVADKTRYEDNIRVLNTAVQFDFTGCMFTPEELATGLELIEKGLLHGPFKNSAYFYRNREVCVRNEDPAIAPPAFYLFTYIGRFRSDRRHIAVPVASVTLDGKIMTHAVGPDIAEGAYGSFDKYERSVSNSIAAFTGFTGMLIGNRTDTERVPASEKLNRRRAKRKHPPINDRFIVRLKVHGGTRTSHVSEGHTGRMVAPHIRRGHFRCYRRGRPDQYMRWVEEMSVNEGVLAKNYEAVEAKPAKER